MPVKTWGIIIANTVSPACALSANGAYLLSVQSGNIWQEVPDTVRLVIYDAATVTIMRQLDLGIPILATNAAMITGISISETGREVCFVGKMWDGSDNAAGASVFLCTVE